jgi:cell division protein ZapA
MDPAQNTVRIFGQEYSVRAESNAEHVREVAELVDQKMREVASASSQVSTVRVAILAALNLADELMSLRSGEMRSVEELDARALRLARALETNLSSEEESAGASDTDTSLRVSESEGS